MTEFPAPFALLKRYNVCSSTVGKKFWLIKVNKKAFFWKFETQLAPRIVARAPNFLF